MAIPQIKGIIYSEICRHAFSGSWKFFGSARVYNSSGKGDEVNVGYPFPSYFHFGDVGFGHVFARVTSTNIFPNTKHQSRLYCRTRVVSSKL